MKMTFNHWVRGLLSVCLWLGSCAVASSTVVINEFHYDDGGTDDREFIELYNGGGAPVDISGWIVQNSDTVAPPGDNNADFTIPGLVGSGTTILAPGDYYVIGLTGVLNVDLVVTGTLENDNEAIQLLDGSGMVVDTISYETNKGPLAVPMEGPGIWSNTNSPDVAGGPPFNVTNSQGRFLDGRDTNNNGRDFGMRPSTPGTANSTVTMTQYVPPDPTGSTVGASVPGLSGTFVPARFIDPTMVTADNPNAIPAAPFTGNAIVAWDPSGGGNAATSTAVFDTTQMGYQIRAYLDTSDQPQNSNSQGVLFTGSEITIYGVGGGDPLTNLTDLGGNIGLSPVALPAAESANGTTGIAWVYERTAVSGATAATQFLYLVDANDGGDSDLGGNTPLDWTVIQAIDVSGLASNWYDLSISVDAMGNVVASFNGTSYMFTSSNGLHSGAFNVGYRENLQIGADGTPDALMRPPTFTIIPEPGALAVMAIGALVLMRRRRGA